MRRLATPLWALLIIIGAGTSIITVMLGVPLLWWEAVTPDAVLLGWALTYVGRGGTR